MKIHEYQGRELFREYGIPTPDGILATTPDEAVKAAEALGLPVVIKAQVHVGGRGKAGGVKVVKTAAEARSTAERILNLRIKDLPVRKVYISPAVNIAKEVYLGVLIDRGARKIVFIGCAEGGVEIEETARTHPEKILRFECTAAEIGNLPKDRVTAFTRRLFPDAKEAEQAADIMVRMGKLFNEKDASLVEINPLIVDDRGRMMALDAKVLLDDNALFRHPELERLRDMDSEDKDELDAKAVGLSFIRLDGTIGCMVNGAGLAMATMDTIKHFGGAPANFLDVGGSSDPEKVVAAFKLILKDPKVKAILINIFGGITRCDDIAKGILKSLEMMQVNVPIVIRLKGTNEEEGRKLLEGTALETARTLAEGATKAARLGGAS